MPTLEPERPINWCRCPLDKETLRKLTARSDLAGLAQAAQLGLLTAALGAVAYYALIHWPLPVAIAITYMYGTVFSFWGLGGAGHELSHRTVFQTRWISEIVLRAVSLLTWVNHVHFRASHMKHHQYTVHSTLDLEVVLPMRLRWYDWLLSFTVNLRFLYFISITLVRHSLGIFNTEWEQRILPQSDAKARRQATWCARSILLGQAAMAAAFIYFGLWPLLVLVTFAPFYGGGLSMLCGFTQHAGMAPSVPDFRLCCRSVRLNRFLRLLYWNMNYHVEHHMYAAVPFHNLPRLHTAIESDLPAACPNLRAAWREILSILRRQKQDPQFVHVPALPQPSSGAM